MSDAGHSRGPFQFARGHDVVAFDHFKAIRRSGATTIARSLDDLVGAVNRYLSAALRTAVCHRRDGQAGQRVYDFILRALDALTYAAHGGWIIE